jgi:hypothetical protein
MGKNGCTLEQNPALLSTSCRIQPDGGRRRVHANIVQVGLLAHKNLRREIRRSQSDHTSRERRQQDRPVETPDITLKRGGTATVRLSAASFGGFSSAVAFSVQGLPAGVSATFAPAILPAPGDGSTNLLLTAGSTATVVKASLAVTARAAGTSRTVSMTVNVTK